MNWTIRNRCGMIRGSSQPPTLSILFDRQRLRFLLQLWSGFFCLNFWFPFDMGINSTTIWWSFKIDTYERFLLIWWSHQHLMIRFCSSCLPPSYLIIKDRCFSSHTCHHHISPPEILQAVPDFPAIPRLSVTSFTNSFWEGHFQWLLFGSKGARAVHWNALKLIGFAQPALLC